MQGLGAGLHRAAAGARRERKRAAGWRMSAGIGTSDPSPVSLAAPRGTEMRTASTSASLQRGNPGPQRPWGHAAGQDGSNKGRELLSCSSCPSDGCGAAARQSLVTQQ